MGCLRGNFGRQESLKPTPKRGTFHETNQKLIWVDLKQDEWNQSTKKQF